MVKKLHTGRSRNDQVAVDIKLWCKQRVVELQESVRNLQRHLVQTAENTQQAVMPGYTIYNELNQSLLPIGVWHMWKCSTATIHV